ncbi:hypothetical protein R6Q59_023360 [Mikania micrantha]
MDPPSRSHILPYSFLRPPRLRLNSPPTLPFRQDRLLLLLLTYFMVVLASSTMSSSSPPGIGSTQDPRRAPSAQSVYVRPSAGQYIIGVFLPVHVRSRRIGDHSLGSGDLPKSSQECEDLVCSCWDFIRGYCVCYEYALSAY